MGKLKDLFVSGSTSEEINMMIDNARERYSSGYVKFLEEQLKEKEIIIDKMSKILSDNNKKETS